MNRLVKLSSFALTVLMATLPASAALAQAGQEGMMDNGMMGGGWIMIACVLLGILLFIALILAILALLKYLLGK